MSEWGRAISTPQDFPSLTVYQRDEATGPVYSIVFENLEFPTGWRHTVAAAGFLILFVSLIPIAINIAGNVLIAWVFLIIGYCVYFKPPWKIKRTILLDMGNDRLMLCRNKKAEAAWKLGMLESLTVDDHPDAEFKRMRRQERGEKRLFDEEKTHCLFGHFGARGANKMIVLERVESPCHYTLQEVQQAILWTIDYARNRGAGERAAGRPSAPSSEYPPRGSQGGINPPLD